MNGEITQTGEGGLSYLLHGKGALRIPKPFEREIFLFDTHVAGTSHVTGIEELVQHLCEGDKLDFFREPDNEVDPQAIMIRTVSGAKILYLSAAKRTMFLKIM